MTIANLVEYRIARLVDELFSTGRYGEPFINPVTGAGFIYGDDDGDFQIEPQKEAACRALLAREHFARVGPPDAQPLPLSDNEISHCKYTWGCGQPPINKAFHFIVSCYAYSLRDKDWDFQRHPSFDDYVRGALALKDLPTTLLPRIKGFDFDGLCKRYPPRPLPGLDPDLIWQPPARTRRAA